MPSNPIQRKTRNAFFLGMLITLIVAILIIAILYFTLFKNVVSNAQLKGGNGTTYAYRLTSAVKSGNEIKMENVERVQLYVDDLPKDCIQTNVDITKCKSKIDIQAGTI